MSIWLRGWVLAALVIGGPAARGISAEPFEGDHSGLRDELREKILREFDANADGQLEGPERELLRKAARERAKTHAQHEMHEKMLKKFDANGDGKLDPVERQHAEEELRKHRAEREQSDVAHHGDGDHGPGPGGPPRGPGHKGPGGKK